MYDAGRRTIIRIKMMLGVSSIRNYGKLISVGENLHIDRCSGRKRNDRARTLRAYGACRALCAIRACRAGDALRTLRADCSIRACRADIALFSLNSLHALYALRTCRALWADEAEIRRLAPQQHTAGQREQLRRQFEFQHNNTPFLSRDKLIYYLSCESVNLKYEYPDQCRRRQQNQPDNPQARRSF